MFYQDLFLTTRSETRPPQSRPAVEIEGEMPENATTLSQEKLPPTLMRSSNSAPFISRPFEPYDDVEGALTPEPIKVVRAKKKTPTKKKKIKDAAREDAS